MDVAVKEDCQLTKYNNMCTAISECYKVDEVAEMRNQARAMEVYAKQAMNTEAERQAVEIRIRAERKAGKLLQGMEKNKGGDKKSKEYDAPLVSEFKQAKIDSGISDDQGKRWQKLAEIDDGSFEERINSIEMPTTTGVIKNKPIATLYTGNNEWYTPSKYIESARLVMGSIDLDPASNETAQKTVKAKEYYTIEDDGLKKGWCGNIWMNPPYSASEINAFVDHFLNCQFIDSAVILTNNSADTNWFKKLATKCMLMCFTTGRINFYNDQGESSSPTNGQTFFYFGDDPDAFGSEFSKYGLIMEHIYYG